MLGQIGLAFGCMNYLTGAPNTQKVAANAPQHQTTDFTTYQLPTPASGGSRKQIHPESGESLTSSNEKITITAKSPNRSPSIQNGAIQKISPLLATTTFEPPSEPNQLTPYGYNAAANIPFAFSHQLSPTSNNLQRNLSVDAENVRLFNTSETGRESRSPNRQEVNQSSIRKRAQFAQQQNKHFLFRQQQSPSPPASNLRIKAKDAIELLSADNLRKTSFRAKGQSESVDCVASSREAVRNIPKSVSVFARTGAWDEAPFGGKKLGLGKRSSSDSRQCLLCSHGDRCGCSRHSSAESGPPYTHALHAPDFLSSSFHPPPPAGSSGSAGPAGPAGPVGPATSTSTSAQGSHTQCCSCPPRCMLVPHASCHCPCPRPRPCLVQTAYLHPLVPGLLSYDPRNKHSILLQYPLSNQ